MPNYRAQVIFQGRTMVPEDRFVNTFHFSGVGNKVTDGTTIAARLAALYNTAGGTPAQKIGDCLSPFVDTAAEIRIYDLAEPEPRVPFTVGLTVAPGTTGTVALPEEVAVCVSFKADPPHTPRRRGRVFLGPLTNAWLTSPGTSGPPVRLAASATARLADLFETHMLVPSNSTTLKWVIHSPSSGLFPIVTSGHIDDALDSVRKRGPDSAARTVFP